MAMAINNNGANNGYRIWRKRNGENGEIINIM